MKKALNILTVSTLLVTGLTGFADLAHIRVDELTPSTTTSVNQIASLDKQTNMYRYKGAIM